MLSNLRKYARIAYLSLFSVAITVFILEHDRISRPNPGPKPVSGVATVPVEIALLMLVLGTVIFLWDTFERQSANLKKDLGMSRKGEAVTIGKPSDKNEETELMSAAENLSSRPNAIFLEDGHLIPVDIHPMTDKVRDRHVISMLLHLAILEEREGKVAPYGVLIMGKDQRRTQIKNTPEKQRWLWTLIEEMRSIIAGVPAVPAPATFKCKNCRVRQFCAFSAYTPGNQSQTSTSGNGHATEGEQPEESPGTIKTSDSE